MQKQNNPSKLFGVLAEFKDPASLVRAVKKVRESGYKRFDAYSPFPIHGMEKALQNHDSRVGWIVLCGGAFGALGGITLQGWVATTANRFVFSGKPFFGWPAFVPVTFECMVLCSAFAAVLGMLALNKLPMLYHALFNSDRFPKASSDGFFLAIEARDPKFNQNDVSKLLKDTGGMNIETITGE